MIHYGNVLRFFLVCVFELSEFRGTRGPLLKSLVPSLLLFQLHFDY
jgi:hypothetical protein